VAEYLVPSVRRSMSSVLICLCMPRQNSISSCHGRAASLLAAKSRYALTVAVHSSGDLSRTVPRQAKPSRTWDDQLEDYVLFVKEQHRTPSQYGTEPNERNLSFWLRNQRASLRNGLLRPE
jgi:DKCLD (NUC011) domain